MTNEDMQSLMETQIKINDTVLDALKKVAVLLEKHDTRLKNLEEHAQEKHTV